MTTFDVDAAVADAVHAFHGISPTAPFSSLDVTRQLPGVTDAQVIRALRRMCASDYRSPQGLRLRTWGVGLYQAYEVAPPVEGDAKLVPMGAGLGSVTVSDRALGHRRSLTADDVAAAARDEVASGRRPVTVRMPHGGIPAEAMRDAAEKIRRAGEQISASFGVGPIERAPRRGFEFTKLGRLGFEMRRGRFTFDVNLRHWAILVSAGIAQETSYVSVLCFAITYDRVGN